MTRVLLTGMGAGAAAALLFASVTSGVGLSVVLFYLAPLPIMIVALGWSHLSGLAAAVAASAMLGGAFGFFFFGMFLVSVGAPAWWLGYLALLGRPIANGGTPHMEWYPPGRLVLWAALIGAAVTAGALATFGGDEATIRSSIRSALEQILQPQERLEQLLHTQGPASGASIPRAPEIAAPRAAAPAEAPRPDPDSPGVPAPDSQAPAVEVPGLPASGTDDGMIEMLARFLPPAAAVIAALTQAANLWLAGIVVRMSGRLRRPWPDLTSLSFPPLAAVLFGGLLGGSLLPGVPGLVASLFAATLTVAFAMVGFAVTHTVTRGMSGRAVVLWGTYLCVLFLLWPVVVMTIIGVAETLFGLRGRLSRRDPPAAHNGPKNGPETRH
jgi:hypothetical protein